MFVPNKFMAINNNVNKIINLFQNTKKSLSFTKAVTCQYIVCAVISKIGVAVDGL